MKKRKLKKISLIILFLSFMFILTGCDAGTEENTTSVNGTTTIKETIVDDDFDEKGTGVLNCITDAIAADGIEVDISYVVQYKRGNILELRSVQRIISNDQDSLDTYEDAFKKIANNYNGLKYYDISLIRDSNTVTYDVVINYDKIDTDALLDIEGAEDNIIKSGKAKLSLWLDLASKVGTTCEEA